MFTALFKSEKKYLGLPVIDWVLIVVALAVYTTITLVTITKSSIWFDEAFGAYLAKFNFLDIARYTATDVHPPVYYWLLKCWTLMFGNSELALRSLSLFFGGVAIVFGYLLSDKLFGKTAARLSLIFLALSPMLVRYGQEARMYTLVAAIALAATYALTFAMKSKKKLPWVIYGILLGLGVWVHYFAAIVWIAHWIWRADIIRRESSSKEEFKKKFFSKDWLLAHFVALGIFLPWLPFLLVQVTIVQVAGFWIPPVTPGTPLNFLTNVVYYRDLNDATGWLAMAFVVVTVALGILAFKIYKGLNKADKQSYRLIMTLAFVPMIIIFVLSMPPLRSVFIDRYLITSVVGIALFIGATLALGQQFITKRWTVVLTVLIAVMMSIGVVNVWIIGNYNKNTQDSNQTRQIVQAAMNKAKPGEAIIAVTPWMFYEEVCYETEDHPVYYLQPQEWKFGSLDMLQYNDAHKIKDISKFAKDHKTIWYIGWIGQGEFSSPYSNWKKLQTITIEDPVSNKPEYAAIEYKIAD